MKDTAGVVFGNKAETSSACCQFGNQSVFVMIKVSSAAVRAITNNDNKASGQYNEGLGVRLACKVNQGKTFDMPEKSPTARCELSVERTGLRLA